MATTTSRLLTLLSLLQSRRDWSGAVLAERLDISHRTVRRDVDRLRQLGYSITATKGPDGGYRLASGSEVPPLLFDDDQVVALAVALQAATVNGAGLEEAALRALAAVRQVLPSRLRHRLDDLEFVTVPHPGDGADVPVSPDVLIALSAAVRATEVLRFDYASRDEDAAGLERAGPRRVEPHELLVSHGRWYLLAWDLERDDWRIFRADRVTPRTPTRHRFTSRPLPGGDARDYVSARFKGSEEVDAWPCIGTVVLHLPDSAVRPFAGDGTVDPLDADRCRYTVGSWSWVALAASLIRFDTDIEVVSPRELIDAFAVVAQRSAATASRRVRSARKP